ncbi:hypothetical protein CQW23_30062 [Capsicum baccatum]|uniref:Uncharacterized protein n=1 Tax=Capsicum baccatum TaxID=33114 RepID=A0A2G2VBH6_CAPBA|nr:hypothetical protein CQW23_30062 [Capsicum baccatum]
MTNKENLGKQYAKVSEEAISGWEKADKQFDKMKNLDQQLLRFAAENPVLLRSLQERSSMVIPLNEEKAQAEVEIEMLKKNMSVRYTEVANQQTPGGSEENCKIGSRASEITWSCVEEVDWAYSLGPDKT